MTHFHSDPAKKPIRAAVFSSLAKADAAIDRLIQAGFTKHQISVICSDHALAAHFGEYAAEPSGEHTPAAAAVGGAIGAALGGLAAVAGASVTGGASLLIAGAVSTWTGGLVGGLVGAMMTRGFEKEPADFYSQAVEQGKILVAVEDHGPHAVGSLAIAEQIFEKMGKEPLDLDEG